MTKRARVLNEGQIMRAIAVARARPSNPLRLELLILLSFRCGLRANEIANIHIEDFQDADGGLCPLLQVTTRGAKFGRERVIELPRSVLLKLEAYLAWNPIPAGPLFPCLRYEGEGTNSSAVQKALSRIYLEAGLTGATSHSGRRTFITNAARKANYSNCSLRDVQYLAGHAQIGSTQAYIELSEEQSRLVNSLYSSEFDDFVGSPSDRAIPPQRWRSPRPERAGIKAESWKITPILNPNLTSGAEKANGRAPDQGHRGRRR